MTEIYDLLHEDHETVKRALGRILDTTEDGKSRREKLFSELKMDLEAHMRFEEEVFYPRFREAKGDKEAKQEVRDAIDEHAEARDLLSEMERMDKGSDAFLEKVKELKEALEHHISDEENEMFPQAREALDSEAARDMGKRYEQMKRY